MEGLMHEIKGLASRLKHYLNLRIELLKSQGVVFATSLFSGLITKLVFVVFFLLAMFFGTLSIGFWLSDLLKSYTLGFIALTAAYLIFAMVVFSNRNFLIKKLIINYSIRRFIFKYFASNEKNL